MVEDRLRIGSGRRAEGWAAAGGLETASLEEIAWRRLRVVDVGAVVSLGGPGIREPVAEPWAW